MSWKSLNILKRWASTSTQLTKRPVLPKKEKSDGEVRFLFIFIFFIGINICRLSADSL